MPDLTALKLKDEELPIDWDGYVDPSEFPPPIPAGLYTLTQGKPKFEASKDGDLVAVMDHTVEGGEYDKSRVTFDRISTKVFERQGVKASMMADQVRALGLNGVRPHTTQEFAEAIEAGEGKPFKAQVDWEAYCNHKDTDFADKPPYTLKGMKSFPQLPSGLHAGNVACATCGKDVNARSRISRRIPA